jgi:hypothetical protein
MITEPLSSNGGLAPLFKLLGGIYEAVAWLWTPGPDSTIAAFRRHVTIRFGTCDKFLNIAGIPKIWSTKPMSSPSPPHTSYFTVIEIYKDSSMWDPIE